MMLRQCKQRHFCVALTHSVSSQSCIAVPHQHQAVAKTEDEGLCHPQTQHHHPKPRRPRPQPPLPSLPTTAWMLLVSSTTGQAANSEGQRQADGLERTADASAPAPAPRQVRQAELPMLSPPML